MLCQQLYTLPYARPMTDITNRSQNSFCEYSQYCTTTQADLLQVMVGVKDKTGLFLSSVGNPSLIPRELGKGLFIVV